MHQRGRGRHIPHRRDTQADPQQPVRRRFGDVRAAWSLPVRPVG
nr:MAG TPA: hypothetical protein [Caudoviricetes sp.]